jgi:fructokinase
MNSRRPCIFGEVLYDHFPDGARVLGGAPFNVAWHLQAFGQAPRFISRVGTDAEGDEIRDAMSRWGMSTDTLQTDASLSTGRVTVSIVDGEPGYDIVRPVAFDAIDAAAVCRDCEVLYHGTLALRDAKSRRALAALTATAPRLVFVDVNLRAPWWDPALLTEALHSADWVKLNADEMASLGDTTGDVDRDAEALRQAHDLDGLIVTRGAAGASVFTRDGDSSTVQPAAGTTVVDTVGAGDAFAAVMLLGLIHGWPHATALARAQSFASRLVANRGATLGDVADYQPFIDAWKIAN